MTGLPEFDRLAGLHADLPVTDALRMHVVIVDVRRAYGRTDVQVVPYVPDSGTGATWVDVHKLKRLRKNGGVSVRADITQARKNGGSV